MKEVIALGVTTLVGIFPAFFFVFASVFTDGGSTGERAVSFLLIAGAYLLLGLASGAAVRSWKAGVWLSAPAVVMIVLYSVREYDRLLLHAAVVAVAIAFALGGAWGGAWVRSKVST